MIAWRFLDTGLRRAAENIAMTRALHEAQAAGESAPTLRLHRYAPCALVGHHGHPAGELDLEWCARAGIEVQRRVSGGGAIYMDAGVLGWELYASTEALGSAAMAVISRRVCEAAAAAVRSLGAPCEFRPPADLASGGRKLGGSGGAVDGRGVLYQGTLLLDFDVARMLCALGAASRAGALEHARAAVVDLAGLLGRPPGPAELGEAFRRAFAGGFGVPFVADTLNAAEERRLRAALADIDTPAWTGLAAVPV